MSQKSCNNNRRPNPAKVYEALHKKRAAECEAREQWAGVTQYFKTWENNSNKFTNWTSPQYYKKSSELQLEMRRREQRKLEEEQEELEKWRKKLRDRQLEDEEFKKGQMKKKPVPLSRPNSAGQKTPSEEMAMELKRKHDAVTDREIELRLHVRSKSCDPKQAKQYEMRERERSSESSWDDRMEEKKSADQKRRERSEHEQQLSEERLAADRFAEVEKHRTRQDRAAQLKDELIGSVAELKNRSDRCDELKRLESAYLSLQDQVEDEVRKNEQLERKKVQSLSRAKALRQYLTTLKQRSKEVVEFIREDRKLVDDLVLTVRRSNAAASVNLGSMVDNLRDMYDRYEEDESQRLYLMDFMFEEEARNMWRSQEERWRREHALRKTGMDDLFIAIKSQLEENINKCLNEQRVLIGEREKLISIIEKGNDELKRLEAESAEFYEQYPDYYGSDDNNNDGVRSSDSTDYRQFEKTALKVMDREQKLMVEMARMNLLNDPKLTDYRRKKSVW